MIAFSANARVRKYQKNFVVETIVAKFETAYRIGEIEKAIRLRLHNGGDPRVTMVQVMYAFPDLSVAEYLSIQRAVLNNRAFKGPTKKLRLA